MVVGDTDLTADAGKTSASRQTFVSGNAARLAAEDLRRKILALANAGPDAKLRSTAQLRSRRRGLAQIDLATLGDVAGECRASATRALSRPGAAHRLTAERRLEGVGSWDPPTTPLDANGQGIPYATYGFAAQMAEVEVDIVLGTTKVIEIVAAHDVGRAINPTLVEGQIHGGIAQGLGMALMEEYIPGRTENLHDYLIPTVGDMPPIKTYLIEDAEPDGSLRRQGRRRAGADRHRAGHPLRHPPRTGVRHRVPAATPGLRTAMRP